MTELTRTVLDFQEKKKSLEDVFKRIAPIIYNYPRRSGRGGEDECGEFLLFFYSRMLRLLKNYSYKADSCFEAYLFLSMKYQYSSFYKRRVGNMNSFGNYDIEYTVTDNTHDTVNEEISEASVNPEMIVKNFHSLCSEKIRKKNVLQKRIMVLALMNCEFISEQETQICADVIGIDLKEFQGMIDTLRQKINSRDHRRQTIRKRRNAAMINLRSIQYKLHCQYFSNDERHILEQRERYYSHLLSNCRRQLRRICVKPMHSEVSEVTGLPEGTIHYTMAYFRRMYQNMSTGMILRMESTQDTMVSLKHDYSTGKQQPTQTERDTGDYSRNQHN
ncbi:hypothetical protein [Spirochaeta dissipatitropha]